MLVAKIAFKLNGNSLFDWSTTLHPLSSIFTLLLDHERLLFTTLGSDFVAVEAILPSGELQSIFKAGTDTDTEELMRLAVAGACYSAAFPTIYRDESVQVFIDAHSVSARIGDFVDQYRGLKSPLRLAAAFLWAAGKQDAIADIVVATNLKEVHKTVLSAL